jgi:hypothetical protein
MILSFPVAALPRFALPSLSGSVLEVEYPWSSFGWYLGAAPEHRPGWMRVDRLLGEHGIQEDSAAVRQEFERHIEIRPIEEADEGRTQAAGPWLVPGQRAVPARDA